jgi:hypothetical protein
MKKWHACLAAIVVLPSASGAEPKIDVRALVTGHEGARFLKGVATLDLQQRLGAVQVRWLGFDHNDSVFAVGVYNAGGEPANFGLENVYASFDGSDVRIFSAQELARQAKSRATWSQIGLALVGAIGSAAAASQRNSHSGSVSGPGGTYVYGGSYPSLAGQLQADAIASNAAFGMALIQQRLDATVGAIGDHVIQRTTVDPGFAYGGLVLVDKVDYGKAPLEMHLTVDWNGERYPFSFLLLKRRQAIPAQFAAMLAENQKPMALRNRIPPADESVQGVARPRLKGSIMLSSGAVKVPAKTKSGYCLITPPRYVATGDINYPIVNGALPRCKEDGHASEAD